MPVLTSPITGVQVNVPEDEAKRLEGLGFKPVEDQPKEKPKIRRGRKPKPRE